jgi:hypothetical protein
MVTVSPDFTGRASDALYDDASREYVRATVGAEVSTVKVVVPEAVAAFPAVSGPVTETVTVPSFPLATVCLKYVVPTLLDAVYVSRAVIVRLPLSERLSALARAVASVVTAFTTTMSPTVTGRDGDAVYDRAAAAVAFAGTDDAIAYVRATVGAEVSIVKSLPLVIVVPVFPARSLPETVTVAVPSTYVPALAAMTV